MATEKRGPELVSRLPASRFDVADATRIQPDIPPTCELFSKEALVERHPNLLTRPRWSGHCGTGQRIASRLLCMNRTTIGSRVRISQLVLGIDR